MTQRSSLYAEEGHKSPALAALLSFVIPGLGQVYTGRLVRGLLLAIPQTAVIVVLGWILLQSPARLGALFIVNAMAIAVLNVLFLFYRAYAVVDAYLLARGSGGLGSSRSGLAASGIALALLLTANVAVHGFAAYTSYVGDEAVHDITGDCANLGEDDLRPRNCPRPTPPATAAPTGQPTPVGQTPVPTPTLAPGETATPSATPVPTVPPGTPYWAEDGRLDVLLLGSDQGEGRTGIRTDTMIVASMDIATGRAAMFGIPRNVINVPLPDTLQTSGACHCFRQMLSGLYTFVKNGTVTFVDGDKDGFRALAETIEETLRVKLDGIVIVNLSGFVTVVDALGGIEINVPEAVYDEQYQNEVDKRELVDIKTGIQHMDGHTALMYVRSRHQDSDYGRMGRQQNFLRAVRAQFTACNLLPRLPGLISAVGDAVRTDIPLGELPALIELMSRSKQPRRFEFTPDKGYLADWSEGGRSLTRVRDAVLQGFQPRQGGKDPAEPDESLPPPPANPC